MGSHTSIRSCVVRPAPISMLVFEWRDGGDCDRLCCRHAAHGERTARVHASRRAGLTVWSGLQNYIIMKSGGSGFTDFHKVRLSFALPKAGARQ
jgi:urate oxidase